MSDEVEINEVLAFKFRDEDLTFLNTMVNRFDFSMGITLIVQGSVISGQLIAGKKYYELTAEKLKSVGFVGEALSQYFESKATNDYTSTDPDFVYPYNFLHLENVCIRQDNGQMNTLNNALLRVKIEEIEGHIIGAAAI
ncbi:gas vesicle protein [Citrobacter sp. Cf140]|uniref:gas vesicle protein n=1 Tax=Citrobacter TaxID=544 RepID=UPI001A2BFDF7|nr:gas vesicle protein [Citrobacter sp. Cf140]MEB1122491.1 gas vesicle protein [Citrobacter freundii]MDM3100025.1 gas vesicle protein [Citrobacter sp. Cf140]HAU5660006.1 gas vesicle protein [Citrobacter freundii]HBV7900240.1 gas vesicle protein [Citrobacter freundii]HCB2471291.1 gas vesicle protein [Citrobacter freundii]